MCCVVASWTSTGNLILNLANLLHRLVDSAVSSVTEIIWLPTSATKLAAIANGLRHQLAIK